MKICSLNFNNINLLSSQKSITHPTPLKYDSVSFSGLQKKSLQGIDYYCAEQFKMPVEKMDSKQDFDSFAGKKFAEYAKSSYVCKRKPTGDLITTERKKILDKWEAYLSTGNSLYSDNPAWALVIFSSIVKNLKPANNNLPPVLNKAVLAATVEQLQETLKKNKTDKFNFENKYSENLKAHYFNNVNQDVESNNLEGGFWVKIPSQKNDSENFEDNVNKLKTLSHSNWCTSSANAEPYLSKGDFHIYMVDGKAKIGVRFDGDKIVEIQGPKNDSAIPVSYLNTIEEYVNTNGFECSDDAKSAIIKAQEAVEKVNRIKNDIGAHIENENYFEILKYLGYEPEKLDSGKLQLSHYKPLSDNYSWDDIGLCENKIYEQIESIKGDADFRHLAVKDLGSLRYIGGSLDLEDNHYIKTLANLEKVGGVINLSGSSLVSLGNLKELNQDINFADTNIEDLGEIRVINGSATFGDSYTMEFSKVKSLGKLQEIQGDAKMDNVPFEDLGLLEKVGGSLTFNYNDIKTLGRLKEIGGDCYISSEALKDLGALTSVNGYFMLSCKNLETLGSLNKVGGEFSLNCPQVKNLGDIEVLNCDFNFGHTNIEDLGKLRIIKGNANFRNSQVKSLGNLAGVKGDVYLSDSKITRLRYLQKVLGNLHLEDSKVKKLDSLKEVGKDLHMERCDVESFERLEKVGGTLFIGSYNYSDKMDEELFSRPGIKNPVFV